LQDKPIKPLDLVKAENGERPIPARPPPPPLSPTITTNGATNGNGAHTNGKVGGTKHDLGDSNDATPAKRSRSDTNPEEQTPNKRTKIAIDSNTAAILIEDDDGTIILD